MTVPDIGRTITEAYGRAFARLATTVGAVLVPALVVGVVSGLLVELQSHVESLALDRVVGAADTALLVAIGWSIVAVFSGIQHRERHGEVVPALGSPDVLPAVRSVLPKLLPRLLTVIALAIVGPVVTLISDSLSVVVGIAAAIALAWLGTRWIYAPVIVGAGEAAGDAAYVRSESHVDPVFWPTLGSFIVIGLGVALPLGVVVALVAAILSIVLPNIFTYACVTGIAAVLGAATVGASALESAWNQVEGGGSEPIDPQAGHTGGPTAVAPVTPAPALEFD